MCSFVCVKSWDGGGGWALFGAYSVKETWLHHYKCPPQSLVSGFTLQDGKLWRPSSKTVHLNSSIEYWGVL